MISILVGYCIFILIFGGIFLKVSKTSGKMTIPKKFGLNDTKNKWSKYIDGVFMPRKFTEIHDKVNDWKVNDEDVWIVSFPKTGTTWTQEMVWLIINDLNYKAAETNLLKRSPQLEATALVRLPHIFIKPLIPQMISDSLKYVANQKSPACIKTHLPWNLLPKEIQKDVKRPKIIYISRDPKDTCLSYYHFSVLTKEFDGTLDEFCNLFLADKLHFTPFWNHVLQFWRRRNQPNILFLKYEELKQDLPAVIERVAKFLEKDVTQEQIDKLAVHLSFENMKSNPAVNYDWLVKISKLYKPVKNSAFMRTGIVGGYKEAMSAEMISRFEKWTAENSKDTGLTYS